MTKQYKILNRASAFCKLFMEGFYLPGKTVRSDGEILRAQKLKRRITMSNPTPATAKPLSKALKF